MAWAPDHDPDRVTELRERAVRLFGGLVTEEQGRVAIIFPGSAPVILECWRDPVGNPRLLLTTYVDRSIDWADERILRMLLEPSSSSLGRPFRTGDHLALMLFLSADTDDLVLGRFAQGITFDAAFLRERINELRSSA
jgi:hypothetical protein